ncbi:MAG TPA: hypothetical protein VEQ59_17155 [Polyangiaceae bacterium]|nr:hypothetical protein [Polyangiaceae bacterium]
MRNRTTQALLVMGAAAGAAAAATWLNKRRLSVVNTSSDALIEPESAELPLGRSADPEVDAALSRTRLPQEDTSGAALQAERIPFAEEPNDGSLDDIWNADSGLDELPTQSEDYDAVNPESLGGVWLERATQTTHAHRSHSDVSELEQLEGLTVSEATLNSSGFAEEGAEADKDEDEDDEEIRDSELDLPIDYEGVPSERS